MFIVHDVRSPSHSRGVPRRRQTKSEFQCSRMISSHDTWHGREMQSERQAQSPSGSAYGLEEMLQGVASCSLEHLSYVVQ